MHSILFILPPNLIPTQHKGVDTTATIGAIHKPISRFNFRSVTAQVLLVSATAFCTIGTFNALQGLGGAGQEEPYTVNAATAINFGLMGTGLPFRRRARHQRGRGQAVDGYIIIGYPRPHWRGRSITLWVAFKELGSIVSASINLGLSAKDNKSGNIGYAVYYATITIMCLAFPISLLLSPTDKVIHSDGTPVLEQISSEKEDQPLLATTPTFKEQYRRLIRQLRKPNTLLIIPYTWFAYFYCSYSHTYVTKHFSVRGRALVSLLQAIGSIIGSVLVAAGTDMGRRITSGRDGSAAAVARGFNKRNIVTIYTSTALTLAVCAAMWGFFAYHAIDSPAKKLDCADRGYASAAVSLMLLYLAMQAAQTYLYWLAAQTSDSVQDTAHLAGEVLGVESLGQCVAYGINTSATVALASVVPNLGFFMIGGTCLTVLVLKIRREVMRKEDLEEGILPA
ncbi:hypothetical protein BX600DRAFT_542233 [Xylariales sp. PMI_506]|nr:hypothetical protein BX600DRAFT_542233 [Xylariales sp. PMI_506]